MHHVLLLSAGVLVSVGSVALQMDSSRYRNDPPGVRYWNTHVLSYVSESAPQPDMTAGSDIAAGPCAALEGRVKMSCYCEQMGLRLEDDVGCVMADPGDDEVHPTPTATPRPTPTEVIDDPWID